MSASRLPIAVSLVSLVLCLCLAACGSSASKSSNASAKSTSTATSSTIYPQTVATAPSTTTTEHHKNNAPSGNGNASKKPTSGGASVSGGQRSSTTRSTTTTKHSTTTNTTTTTTPKTTTPKTTTTSPSRPTNSSPAKRKNKPKPSTNSVPPVALLAGPKVSGASGAMHVWLHGQNHAPVIGKLWHYSVLATHGNGQPLSGKVDTEFVFNGTVVGREVPPTHPLKNGRLNDAVTYPARAAGIPLTFRVVIHTPLGSVTLNWPVKVVH